MRFLLHKSHQWPVLGYNYEKRVALVHKCRVGMKTGHEFGPEIIGHEKNHALKDIWGSLGRKKNHAGSVGYRPVLLRKSCPPRGMENALSKSIRGCDFYSRILFCTQ